MEEEGPRLIIYLELTGVEASDHPEFFTFPHHKLLQNGHLHHRKLWSQNMGGYATKSDELPQFYVRAFGGLLN